MEDDPGPYLLPAGILGEATYLIEDRLGAQVLDAFLNDIETGAPMFDCGEGDWPRLRELVVRHANLPLGAADASIVACAERAGGLVLTLDQRDFSIVSKEGSIRALP
jgi:predicted nucleic acid-binding protein